MKKEFTSGESWNSAALAGLVMAAVTIAAELIGTLTGKIPGFLGGAVHFLAWAGKLVLCAVFFRYLMKRFHTSFDGIDYPRLQRYGMKLALFSSIIVAAWAVVNFLVFSPGSMEEIMATVKESYASMMDSNSEAALERMLPKMPYYIAVGSVIYCFLWGWLYSTLFARNIAPNDPFSRMEEPIDNQ